LRLRGNSAKKTWGIAEFEILARKSSAVIEIRAESRELIADS